MIKPFKDTLFIFALLFPISAFAANPAVLFVFDGSGSMWGQVDGKTKIELAKQAMAGLVKDFPAGTDIGLISYGHRKEGDCNDIETLASLGSSKDSVISAIQSINPKGKTPLTKSIQFAAEQLKNRDAPTSIIVVSDGKESCNADPCAAAKAVREAGVNLKIHVVGFDVKKDEAEQLQCIAKNGGGKYFAARNASELAKSFAEVKKEVVEVKKEIVEVKPKPVKKKPEVKTIFRDDFNDDFLGEKWEMLDEDLDLFVLDEGKLMFINSPTKNKLMYRELLDKPNMNIIAEFSMPLPSAHPSAGIALRAGKDDFLAVSIVPTYGWGGYGPGSQTNFAKRLKGKDSPTFSGAVWKFKDNSTVRKYRLKIEKRKYKYSAFSYNFSKKKWLNIGEFRVLGKKYKGGFYAHNSSKGLEAAT